jgi:hypothetical protein
LPGDGIGPVDNRIELGLATTEGDVDEIVLTSRVGPVARRVRYEQVTHGVHATRGSVAELSSRCRAIQRVLPSEALFSHFTGARLRGWQLPALPEWLPIFASLPRDGTHLKRRGVYIARTDEASVGAELRHGARVAAPWAILAQLAQHLSLLDLIAVVDSALQIGDCKPYDIEESIRLGQWGGTRLRRALEFADGRAESWWETPLRLLHVWSGIDVVPQYEVRDRRGNLIARGDLWIVGTKRLHEYDGGHHDRPGTRRIDLTRDKALSRIEWERYGYVAIDLTRGADRIIRDAETALGLAHRRTRLQRWRAEAARSTLSVRGRAALARRLVRYDRR